MVTRAGGEARSVRGRTCRCSGCHSGCARGSQGEALPDDHDKPGHEGERGERGYGAGGEDDALDDAQSGACLGWRGRAARIMCDDGAGVTSATAYSVSMTFLHFRSALESPPNRRPTHAGRTLHDNKAGAFKMPYKALCDDVSHELGRVPHAAPSVELQRERECVRKVVRVGGREAGRRLGHLQP